MTKKSEKYVQRTTGGGTFSDRHVVDPRTQETKTEHAKGVENYPKSENSGGRVKGNMSMES